MNSESTTNKQVLSSRINEVHCGILKTLKRYRNKCGMTHFVKCVAFTLAETLVVMGIIGVVAALTIPNLNQSTGDREKVAKVKKIYSNLEDAYGRATAVYGPLDEWFNGLSERKDKTERVGERLSEFMKVSKNCKMQNGCYIAGSDDSDWYQFVLADGTSVGLTFADSRISILVDIDGLNKGQNKDGYDKFRFGANTLNGLFPSDRGFTTTSYAHTCETTASGTFCAAWVIDYGNMDYLKADDNGLCPDGKTTLNPAASPPVTSCK